MYGSIRYFESESELPYVRSTRGMGSGEADGLHMKRAMTWDMKRGSQSDCIPTGVSSECKGIASQGD